MPSSKKRNSARATPHTLMLAYLCIRDVGGLNDRVSILDRFGLIDSEIAVVCDVAEQSVKNARQRNRKQNSRTDETKRKRTTRNGE